MHLERRRHRGTSCLRCVDQSQSATKTDNLTGNAKWFFFPARVAASCGVSLTFVVLGFVVFPSSDPGQAVVAEVVSAPWESLSKSQRPQLFAGRRSRTNATRFSRPFSLEFQLEVELICPLFDGRLQVGLAGVGVFVR